MALEPAGRGPQIMAVYLFFLSICTVTTWLRVYCRAFVVKQFGIDDGLALVAWALFSCYATFAIVGCYHGTGQHATDIQPPMELITGLKYWWLCEPFYVLAGMAIKGSIAMMLLRILVAKTHRVILYTTLFAYELYSFAFFLIFVFQCWPVSNFWLRFANVPGKCVDTLVTVNATFAYSAVACASDWIFSILPFIVVMGLNMKRRDRFMVGIVLAMSAVASIATIARFPYVHTLGDSADFLYATADVAIWSCCEEGLAITACCAATLRPMFRQIWGQTRLNSSQSGRRTPGRPTYQEEWPLPAREPGRPDSRDTDTILLPVYAGKDRSEYSPHD